MKKINYIKKGETISLVAPSFGCVIEPYITRLNMAIKNFKKMGFELDEGPNIFVAKCDTRSNTPKKCAKEIMDAFESDSKMIISVGGGETMCEILPYIDFDRINELPHKFYMGFSDNTNLTYTLTTICDLATIYGPCAGQFCFPLKYDTKDAFKLFTGKTKVTSGYPVFRKGSYDEFREKYPYKREPFDTKKITEVVSKDGYFNVNGILLGGCIDCLVNLCGTKYDKTVEYIEKYKDKGYIWFLECCDFNPLDLERALFHLKEAGWFKYAKGFIFGRPYHYDEVLLNTSFKKAIANIMKGIKLPYLLDADLGHLSPSMPIITGAYANVQFKRSNMVVKYLDI